MQMPSLPFVALNLLHRQQVSRDRSKEKPHSAISTLHKAAQYQYPPPLPQQQMAKMPKHAIVFKWQSWFYVQ